MINPVELVLSASAFIFGACIGSFLNVCIYRWPLGMKVNSPARSFCPVCHKSIAMWQNIPLLSWLLLRAKCSHCKTPIPIRYIAVELLTALIFLGLWKLYPPALAVALAALAVACIVTVFVDFEHYVIPNQVTWGFMPVGLLASALVPALHQQILWWRGLLAGVVGLALGLGALWLVVELGKRAFGKKTRQFAAAVGWEIHEGPDEAPVFELDGESLAWQDIFSRPSDRLILSTDMLMVDGQKRDGQLVRVAWDHLEIESAGGSKSTVALADIKVINGTTRRVVVPREAMGMGDVYFLGMAGTFVGWQGVLFTIFAGSVIGTLFGLLALVIGRRTWAGQIPFGPWLVVGLWTWILAGPAVLGWYFKLLGIQDVPAF